MQRILVLVTGLLLVAVTAATANPITVTGEGDSKEHALSAALRRAVEQGVGTLVKSETTVVDSALVDDKIYSRSKGYVKTYKILKEQKTDEGMAVTVSALVDTKVLQEDMADVLKILQAGTAVNNPRILVAFSAKSKDKIFRDKEFTEEIYNGIVESLTDQQFRVVDKAAAEQFGMQVSDTHAVDVDLNKAAAYGRKYHAEYTLYYNVSGVVREGAVGKSVLLNIKTQLIDNTRAQVITSKKVEQSGMGQTVDQALEKAARDGGKKIVTPMIDVLQKEWMDMQQNGAFYTIVIDGLDDPELIAQFTEMFEKFPLASQAREVESGGGITTFEARYKGKRDRLDRDVLRTARELGWVLKKVRAEGARSTWKRL
jgi:nucleotide-binding universal stress UspA family protein